MNPLVDACDAMSTVQVGFADVLSAWHVVVGRERVMGFRNQMSMYHSSDDEEEEDTTQVDGTQGGPILPPLPFSHQSAPPPLPPGG